MLWKPIGNTAAAKAAPKLLPVRQFLCLLLTALCLLHCLLPAPAHADGEANRTVRIGYIDYAGFINKQPNGNFAGYGVDLLSQLSLYTGWQYEFVYDSWHNQLQNLRDGRIDFLCHAQKTPEREAAYIFSKYPSGNEAGIIYVRPTDNRYYYNDFANFNGLKIAMMSNSFQNEALAKYAAAKNFSYTPSYYATETEAFIALNSGEADAVAMGSMAAQTGYKIICRFDAAPFYFMASPANSDLMSQMDDALNELLGTAPYYLETLHKDYYGGADAAHSLNLSREEAAYIEAGNVIKVGQLRHRYPISDYNETTGSLSGINEDILDLLAQRTGLRFEAAPFGQNQQPMQALKANQFDLVMGILKADNFRDDPTIRLSNVFNKTQLSVVKPKGTSFDPRQDYRVAIKPSFQVLDEYLAANYPHFKRLYYGNDAECADALINGDVDILVQNVYVENHLLQNPRYESLEMLPTAFMIEKNVLATRSDTDPRLISIINKGLKMIGDNEINDIILKHTTAKPYVLTTGDLMYKYRLPLLLAVIFIAICIALITVIAVTRHRNVRLLQSKNRQLSDALLQTEHANTAKSQFLSRMSHEIRTPMNAIVGLTNIAQRHKNEPDKVTDSLEKIDASCQLLLNIINDVLDMSAIEINKLRISAVEFDIKQVLQNITSIYYPQCKAKGLEFNAATNISNELLIGDSLRVNQILLNLISNAFKFTDPGGKINIFISQTNKVDDTVFLRFIVADTGHGIAPEMLSRLFKPFEQETATTAQKYGGSGLGLSIVKNLVTLMHGAVSVESTPGAGTTFTVELPFKTSGGGNAIDPEKMQNIRVLLVDDDPTSLEYSSIVLERIGVQYNVADSGEAALRMITEAYDQGRGYNVCFIDWKMPEVDGLEVARKIRQLFDKDTIIIIISAYDMSDLDDHSQSAGADMFVTKPLFQSTVFNVLMQLSGGALQKKAENGDAYDFSGRKLLLVDDNSLNREITCELLSLVKMDCDQAENGQQAVAMFTAAAPGTYAAILMDVQMPIMDGYEATRAIRASEHPEAHTITIYAMTANAFTEDISSALSAGMDGHIAKPVDCAVLYEALAKAIAKQSGAETE